MTRRCIAILLLILLPLQFSWAGIAAYCQHETGQAAQHIGHHEHTHTGTDTQGSASDIKAQWGFDTDCSACYSGFISAVPHAIPPLPLLQFSTMIDWAPYSLAAPPTILPERPNWSAHA